MNNPDYPGVYAPTKKLVKLLLRDKVQKIGYFQEMNKSSSLEKENKYTFIELSNTQEYKATKDDQYVTVIEGDLVLGMENLKEGS